MTLPRARLVAWRSITEETTHGHEQRRKPDFVFLVFALVPCRRYKFVPLRPAETMGA
jgi:hypothetical protein